MSINGFHTKESKGYARLCHNAKARRRNCLRTMAKLREELVSYQREQANAQHEHRRKIIANRISELKELEIIPRNKKLTLINREIRYYEELINQFKYR